MTINNKKIRSVLQNLWKYGLLGIGVSLFLNMGGRSSFASILDKPFFRASSIVIVIGGSDFIENGGAGRVATDFYLLDNVPSGQLASDIIGADGVTLDYFGGSLTPTSDGTARSNELLRIEGQTHGGTLTNVADFNILNADDSLTEFGIDDITDIDMSSYYRLSRFFVTSNSAFDIYAEASNLTATNDFTSLGYSDFRYGLFTQVARGGANGWGSAAQDPRTGGQGRVPGIYNLGHISGGPTKVYDGGRRTARTRGTIMQQAVSFVPLYYIYNGDTGNAYDLSMGTGTIGATVTYTIYTP